MIQYLTILSLAGAACAPAPSTADQVMLTEPAPEAPKEDGQAPEETPPAEPPAEDPPGDEVPPSEPGEEPPPPAEPVEPAEPAPQLPPGVSLGEVKFINGEVPKVESFLEKMKKPVASCVAEHGGLPKEQSKLEIQFLVRLRGKAEGVEVLKRDGVSEEAERCIRQVFKDEWVGTPTSDPTGVVFFYELERRPGE